MTPAANMFFGTIGSSGSAAAIGAIGRTGVTIGMQIALALVLIGAVADLVLYLRYGASETISRGMWHYGKDRVWVQALWMMAAGLLALHFWT
jgi:hypothetical protein